MGFRFWNILVSVPLLVGATTAAPAPTPRAPALSWVFDIHKDKQHVPQGKVFLKVGTRRVQIEPDAQFGFRTLSRADYKDHKVPASALTACWGWFAGGGEVLYVAQHKKTLKVYRRWEDEQAPDFPYRLIRTVPLTGK